MKFMKMFLKRWQEKKYNYFKGKANFYYALYQKEKKKETTFSSSTHVINGEEETVVNYTEHVPFFLNVNEKTSKSLYFERYLFFLEKANKHYNPCR